MRINITDQEAEGKDSGRKVLEKGRHQLRITACQDKTSKSGKPMLELELEKDDIKVWDYILYLNAKWKLSSLLKACELPYKGDIEVNPDDLIGCYVEADVDIQDDPNWGKQNRIKRYYAASIEQAEDTGMPF